ncbi:MAG: 2-oxoacid:acceptor oxidoreductase subunit alpha, partial [Candidatus Cloacimonetes bacterium]|nr:2-oxoacid:acceptor oxidoreductase subunit alpha [Candidatus Cloacimonadota bacterium]
MSDKKVKKNKIVLMQGNEAIARGAIDAGVNFFGGYPITPSTEIAEICSVELPKRGGKFIQMEDEIAGISSVIGASLAGAKAMTATSGPGFSLMTEGIGFAKMTETPCVVVNVMRGGPSTGLPTKPSQSDIMQSKWGNHGDAPAIVLYPDSVKESYELAIRAVNLSEKYRTCVVLLSDEVLGHMREAVELPDLDNVKIINRIKPTIPPEWYKHYEDKPKYIHPMASYGEGYRFHVTGLAHDAYGFPTNRSDEVGIMMNRLKKKIKHNLKDLIQYESFHMEDARTAIFAAGITA